MYFMLIRMWIHDWIRSWNKAVLNNKGKVLSAGAFDGARTVVLHTTSQPRNQLCHAAPYNHSKFGLNSNQNEYYPTMSNNDKKEQVQFQLNTNNFKRLKYYQPNGS